jgi:hypothetical protein
MWHLNNLVVEKPVVTMKENLDIKRRKILRQE